MKKLLLSLIILTTSVVSSAQVIFGITSNLCDTTTQHNYNFGYAGELDGSSTDWNTPNMTLDSNAISGCLVLVNDGATPGDTNSNGSISFPSISDACDSVSFEQDLTGKIAVLYRGACEFSLKVYNAQKRGAIGVIIINNQSGTAIAMAGGTLGGNVTIPAWLISDVDGVELAACLDTVCTGVTGYFGADSPLFENDMATNKSLMLMTESSAMPWDLARNGTEYPVDLGLWVYNKGWSVQSGVTVTVDISFGGNVVFTNTSTTLNFNTPDTTFIDSQYVDLGTYAPANWNIGTYTITYTINNPNEEDLTNNSVSFEFKLTNNEDVYAKCRLDGNNKPIHNTAYTLNSSIWETMDNCIVFRSDVAGDRGAMASGLTFIGEPIGVTMTGEYITTKVYEWNDVFLDINSPATYNSLNLINQTTYMYQDEMLNGVNVYVPFSSPISLANSQRYLFCVSPGIDSIRIGYDTYNVNSHPEGIDYTTTINHYSQPISPVAVYSTELGTPIPPAQGWYTEGFGYDTTPAISVTMDIATGIDENETTNNALVYPNPATNYLTVPVRKNVKGKAIIELFDLAGKLVLSENQIINNEPLKLNVSALANGNYIFKLAFENGTSDTFKVSINR